MHKHFLHCETFCYQQKFRNARKFIWETFFEWFAVYNYLRVAHRTADEKHKFFYNKSTKSNFHRHCNFSWQTDSLLSKHLQRTVSARAELIWNMQLLKRLTQLFQTAEINTRPWELGDNVCLEVSPPHFKWYLCNAVDIPASDTSTVACNLVFITSAGI